MIAAGADVYVSQMTFGGKLQPLIVSVASKDMPLEVASIIFGVRIPPGAVRKKGPKKAYQCQACGTIFESDGTECPECSSKVVKELTGETASSNTVA
jgi:rRNA maturation endonuclease Nob1